MNKCPSKHTVVFDLHQLFIGMKERMNDQDSDKLSTYGQDVLHLLVFPVKEMLALLEFVTHSSLEVLKY